jgi:predicted nucleic acid-binding protein
VIFADTSYWIALQTTRDARHGEARRLARLHGSESVLTTDHVRGETWTFVRRRSGHRDAVAFLDLLERSPRLSVELVTPEDQGDALAWLRRHDEREYSFVDATSFAVMRRRRITEAFAFDGDFAAAGFVELRP